MMNPTCAKCGRSFRATQLDGKPNSSRFRQEEKSMGQYEALSLAADRGEDFVRLECRYGPCFVSMSEATK